MGLGAAAAGLGAVGSIGGALISSSASKSAADTQSQAAQLASQNSLAEFQQIRGDLAPYRNLGAGAGAQLAAILGLPGSPTNPAPPPAPAPAAAPAAAGFAGATPTGAGTPLPQGISVQYAADPFGTGTPGFTGIDSTGKAIAIWDQSGTPLYGGFAFPGVQTSTSSPVSTAPPPATASGPIGNPLSTQYGLSGLTFQPTEAQLAATPGYQFDLGQGLQSVQNSNAAKGLGISGAALKGAASYATGLADKTLTTQQGIFQQNLGNVLNPLMSLTNLGENASATTGNLGVQSVGNSNTLQVGAANAQAAGTIGAANAAASGLSSLGSAPLNYLLYSQLLGGGGGGGGGGPVF